MKAVHRVSQRRHCVGLADGNAAFLPTPLLVVWSTAWCGRLQPRAPRNYRSPRETDVTSHVALMLPTMVSGALSFPAPTTCARLSTHRLKLSARPLTHAPSSSPPPQTQPLRLTPTRASGDGARLPQPARHLPPCRHRQRGKPALRRQGARQLPPARSKPGCVAKTAAAMGVPVGA